MAAGLSVRTLQRRCQAELGVPLQAWLHRARIVTALELLADPAASVGEIAVRVGYGSGAAFTRSFAEIMGSPPSEWRGRGARYSGPMTHDPTLHPALSPSHAFINGLLELADADDLELGARVEVEREGGDTLRGELVGILDGGRAEIQWTEDGQVRRYQTDEDDYVMASDSPVA